VTIIFQNELQSIIAAGIIMEETEINIKISIYVLGICNTEYPIDEYPMIAFSREKREQLYNYCKIL